MLRQNYDVRSKREPGVTRGNSHPAPTPAGELQDEPITTFPKCSFSFSLKLLSLWRESLILILPSKRIHMIFKRMEIFLELGRGRFSIICFFRKEPSRQRVISIGEYLAIHTNEIKRFQIHLFINIKGQQ